MQGSKKGRVAHRAGAAAPTASAAAAQRQQGGRHRLTHVALGTKLRPLRGRLQSRPAHLLTNEPLAEALAAAAGAAAAVA